MLSFDEALRKAATMPKGSLIAVDGLPCSGKSTFGERLRDELSLTLLSIDDFYIEPPTDCAPAFPFPFFQNDAFIETIQALKSDGEVIYYPFNWDDMKPGNIPRALEASQTIIVEGCGTLHPSLSHLYDLSFFVESDRASIFEKVMRRDGDFFIKEWQSLFLPSDDIYMATRPQERATHLIAGRGYSFDI